MDPKGYHKGYVFSAACIGMLLFGMTMISLGSILPEVSGKFGLNEVEKGFLLTLLPIGILMGSLLFGPLADWLSYKRILIFGCFFTLLGLQGIVFSKSLIFMQLSVLCIGFGGGVLNGITNALVSEISEEDHSANLSLLGIFYGVGALGTPVLLGALEGRYSFEAIFAIFGVCIAIFLFLLFWVRFPKSDGTNGIPIKQGLAMLKDPVLLLFGFILFFQSGMEGLTSNWTTTYLETVKQLESSQALFALSSFVGALTVARLILGRILRVFDPLKVMVIGFGIAFIGVLCIRYGGTYGMLMTGMLLLGVGLAAGFPVILGYIGQLYTQLSGTAFSIVITISLIGNVIANYAMGQVSQLLGTAVLPYFLLASVSAGLVLIYATKKKYQNIIP
ncbi:MAG: MFS transporter [Bacteroidota bacterium]